MGVGFQFDQSDIASRYDLGRKSTAASTTFISQWLLSHGPSTVRRVLDLGCGTGRFTQVLADTFDAPVVGIDLASSMLEVATTKARSPHVRFVRGSVMDIPAASQTFDVAFFSQVVHHLPNLVAAMAEIRRVLATGGRLFIRQTTLENLDSYSYQGSFPEARAIDDARLPARSNLIDAAAAAKLSLVVRPQTFSTEVASTSQEYIAKVATRTYSDLAMIADESFRRGLDTFADAVNGRPDQAWTEDVDYLVFQRVE